MRTPHYLSPIDTPPRPRERQPEMELDHHCNLASVTVRHGVHSLAAATAKPTLTTVSSVDSLSTVRPRAQLVLGGVPCVRADVDSVHGQVREVDH